MEPELPPLAGPLAAAEAALAPAPASMGDAARVPGLRMVRDVAAAMGRHAAIALASLATVPLIARRVGGEGLGAWALLGTTSFLLSMSDLGLTTVVHRAAAVRDSPERARRAVGVTTLVIVLVAPVAALAGYLLLVDLSGASAALQRDLSHAALLALPAGVIGAVASPFRGFSLVRGAITGLARIRIAASIVQVVVTAGGLWLTPSLVAPAAGLLVGATVETAFTLRLARSLDAALPLLPLVPSSPTELRALLRDGAATLVLNLVLAAGTRADLVILASVGSLTLVAAYSVASRAVDQSFVLAKQTSTAMLPRLADVSSRGEAVRVGTGMLGALVASGITALIVNGQPLLVAWAGPVAGGPVTGHALTLLGIAAVIASMYQVSSSALTLTGRTAWDGAIPLVVAGVVNIAISVLGAPHFGVWAVAGGTVIGNALAGAMIWRRAGRLLGWSGIAVARALIPGLLAGAASLGVSVLVARFLTLHTAGSAAACVVATGVGCGAAFLSNLRMRA